MKNILFLIIFLAIGFLSINSKAQQSLPDGSTAPNFTFTDLNGTSQNLYSYLNAGKVVIIDASATWCGPCWNYHTSGELKTFYNTYGPPGTNVAMVLFIECDGATNDSCMYGNKTLCPNTQGNWVSGTPYPMCNPPTSTAFNNFLGGYNVVAVPTVYMICPDKKTTLVSHYTSAQLYNKMMEKCPPVVASLDAGIYVITSPDGAMCSTTISPIVTIRNWGSTTLTSCTINYKVDAGTVQTYNWSGSLATWLATSFTLPNITTTIGSHTFTVYTSKPNGSNDGNLTNDKLISNFSVTTIGTSLPITEGFESSTSIPINWSLYNPDNDAKWQINTTIAHNGTRSIAFNNCDGNGLDDMTGKRDRFYTALYDFSNIASPNISFDIAYANLLYQGHTYGDTLIIYSTVNCGNTWSEIYRKGGSVLASAPVWTTAPNCWFPSSSQWRTDNISLNNLSGQPTVMFAFENRSSWAEWIFIDNINITNNTNVVTSYTSDEGLSIYPNPATSSFTLEGTSIAEKIQYSLYNIVGKVVKSGYVNVIGSHFQSKVQTSDMSNGIYLLKVTDGSHIWMRKITIQ